MTYMDGRGARFYRFFCLLYNIVFFWGFFFGSKKSFLQWYIYYV